MPDQKLKKDDIIITRIWIPPDDVKVFADWQSKLQDVVANAPGFLSLEILAPNSEHPAWTLVQRFTDVTSGKAWKNSLQRQNLFNEWTSIHKQTFEDLSSPQQSFKGVTEVIVTEVSSEKKGLYRQWLAKIHQAEAKVPGFAGMYVQTPVENQGRYWITFLQFDTSEHLDQWLESPERKEILKELDPLIKSFESHRIISPYAGWFGSIAKMGAIPPVWKQTMLVLLVLFPIVMLELKFLSPLLNSLSLNSSVATFIGNSISVVLIAWPMMPIAIFFFQKWLNPEPWNHTKINILGTAILIALYLFEILIFWRF